MTTPAFPASCVQDLFSPDRVRYLSTLKVPHLCIGVVMCERGSATVSGFFNPLGQFVVAGLDVSPSLAPTFGEAIQCVVNHVRLVRSQPSFKDALLVLAVENSTGFFTSYLQEELAKSGLENYLMLGGKHRAGVPITDVTKRDMADFLLHHLVEPSERRRASLALHAAMHLRAGAMAKRARFLLQRDGDHAILHHVMSFLPEGKLELAQHLICAGDSKARLQELQVQMSNYTRYLKPNAHYPDRPPKVYYTGKLQQGQDDSLCMALQMSLMHLVQFHTSPNYAEFRTP